MWSVSKLSEKQKHMSLERKLKVWSERNRCVLLIMQCIFCFMKVLPLRFKKKIWATDRLAAFLQGGHALCHVEVRWILIPSDSELFSWPLLLSISHQTFSNLFERMISIAYIWFYLIEKYDIGRLTWEWILAIGTAVELFINWRNALKTQGFSCGQGNYSVGVILLAFGSLANAKST